MVLRPSSRRVFLQQSAVFGAALLPFGRFASGAEAAKEEPAENPLRSAMERVHRCCLAWLNPDEHFLPTGGYETAHDTGRWWDSMLRCEAVTGLPIPKQAEEAMLENLRAMTDNPAALLTNVFGPPSAYRVNLHNIRETLLTYTALVKYRKSDWACGQGRKLIAAVGGLLNPDGQLDYARLGVLMEGRPVNQDPLMVPSAPEGQWFDSTATTGRAMEGMVWFSEATGDADAMQLAGRLADIHLRNIIDPGGRVRAELLDPGHVGHNHSYCGMLRGLVLYGLASGERRYVDAVAKTYRNGLWGTTISRSGWTPHDLGKARFPNEDGDPLGEHGSCSDVVQLALWLGLRDGQTDLLDDTERLIRARLLPAQMNDPDHPRNHGAWGVYSHPYGRGSTFDVFAAVLHCLSDVSKNAVTVAADGTVSVNLHFGCDTPELSVQSKRGDSATVVIVPKRSFPLRVRVPAWTARDSVQIRVDEKPVPLHWDGSYLALDAAHVAAGRPVTLQHDLPSTETVEEMPVSKKKFRLAWRGDEVVACDPCVPIYPCAGKA